MNQTLTSLL